MSRAGTPLVRLLLPAALAALVGGCGPAPSAVTTPAGSPTLSDAAPAPAPRSPAPDAPAGTAHPGGSPSVPTSPVPRLVVSARWVTRDGVRTLVVVPTTAGRTSTDPLLVWSELLRRVPSAGTPGMRDQLVCHQLFAPDKAQWNLEPSRPAVGLDETIKARCNPGPQPDPDAR